MPIVINRITGEVTHLPITPAQQEQLLGAIIKAYTDKHPEVFSDNRTSQLDVKIRIRPRLYISPRGGKTPKLQEV